MTVGLTLTCRTIGKALLGLKVVTRAGARLGPGAGRNPGGGHAAELHSSASGSWA